MARQQHFVGQPINCHAVYGSAQISQWMPKISALLRHHGADLNADNSIYSHNQPVYGDPIFENGRDPLRGNRRILQKVLRRLLMLSYLKKKSLRWTRSLVGIAAKLLLIPVQQPFLKRKLM